MLRMEKGLSITERGAMTVGSGLTVDDLGHRWFNCAAVRLKLRLYRSHRKLY